MATFPHRIMLSICFYMIVSAIRLARCSNIETEERPSDRFSSSSPSLRLEERSAHGTARVPGNNNHNSSPSSVKSSPHCLPTMPTVRQCCTPSVRRSCRLMDECRSSMCGSGQIPIACLGLIGQRGPHQCYASHRPFFVIVRQGGYGISVGRGFTPQLDPADVRAVSTLAMTDLTDVEINLAELEAVGSSPTMFKATVHAQGAKSVCAQQRAKLKVRAICINNGDWSKTDRALRYDSTETSQTLNVELHGCTKLLLKTTLVVNSRMTFALRRACYALWTDAVIIAPRQENPCDLVCNQTETVALTCLNMTRKVLPPLPSTHSTFPSDAADDSGRPSISEIKPYSSFSDSKQPVRLRPEGKMAGDISLPLDENQPRAAYAVDIHAARRLGKKFDFLSSQLMVRLKQRGYPESCEPTALEAVVDFEVLVNKRSIWQRRMAVKSSTLDRNVSVSDIGSFALDVWQVRTPRAVTLKAELKSLRHAGNCSLGILAVFKSPQLKRQVKPPQFFASCKQNCLDKQQAGDGTIYLSCFLGMRNKQRPSNFSCTGTITGRNNSFMKVSTNGGKGRIGVDRAGPWTSKHQLVTLITPHTRSNITEFQHAIGAHPNSRVVASLTAFRETGQAFNTFSAVIGLDVRSGCSTRHLSSVRFEVWLDRKLHYFAEVSHAWATKEINIDVTNALELMLVTAEGRLHRRYSNCRPAVWANARLAKLSLAES
eukprot:scpid36834/ scgid25929/ 